MRQKNHVSILLITLLFYCQGVYAQHHQFLKTQVLVIGGGVGGTAAGIQSARSGVQTMIVEETPWLGGMLSSAGVSATDGNHELYSGIWQEFREALYRHYGTKNLATGWVSYTLFEPHVADSIFKAWAGSYPNLQVKYRYRFLHATVKNGKITAASFINTNGELLTIHANVVIDASEMGDVLAAAHVPYSLGMEADKLSGENSGVGIDNNIVQDMTYAAILKEYDDSTHLLNKPDGYDPKEFDGACTSYYKDTTLEKPTVDARKMLEYGKLPHQKFMLNWPKHGNDTYLNLVEMNAAERETALLKAKATTFRFIYFIQHELGFRRLGIATDEFPTRDHLPFIAYYREGRRVKGLVRLTTTDIMQPFSQQTALYRTAIAVGDYPIDHHHGKNPAVKKTLYFPPVPSFSIPAGTLLNSTVENLIAAEKAISVTNIVNGSTRLQPCVLLTGQAAGVIASEAVKQKRSPGQVGIRHIQSILLKQHAYLMPYIDVRPWDTGFVSIQKIGATGILRGVGKPHAWANQTWFYPDSSCSAAELYEGLTLFTKGWNIVLPSITSSSIALQQLLQLLQPIYRKIHPGNKLPQVDDVLNHQQAWWHLKNLTRNKALTRGEAALIIDKILHPFESREVNWQGAFQF
ncbi:FAD dependent oxidoreductase [Hydrobacter penzbergensis]|uniref:FAD dependent oxidoreductase n=1 Tax=Hydrobacter penzbergensis TaxID=1235997 RepID=A0A8X8ICN1_9BACT|nr:FAD-dependent oxidoreductase [Hydrobacter penzbergensis]SDW94838.1 FAD dependent oxidoreductase [Hydrobacter penzbergensis]